MRLIFLGAPGSGKGTQSKRLVRDHQMIQISTGDLLREAVAAKSDLGLKAKALMDSGNLVPDELVVALVKEKMKQMGVDKPFIFDGFPRTLPQAISMDQLLSEFDIELDRVIFLKVPREELVKRLSGRRVCSQCGASYHVVFEPPKVEGVCDECGAKAIVQRSDDREDIINQRFRAFESQTAPLVAHYAERGQLLELDGMLHPDEVTRRIKDELGLA